MALVNPRINATSLPYWPCRSFKGNFGAGVLVSEVIVIEKGHFYDTFIKLYNFTNKFNY